MEAIKKIRDKNLKEDTLIDVIKILNILADFSAYEDFIK